MGHRLNFVHRSYQGHANHCVTFAIECLGNRQEIKAWFQRKWPMDYQMYTWSMTSRGPERSNSWSQYA